MSRKRLSGALLETILAEAGIAVAPGAVDKLVAHAREMLLWNRSIRLTAVTDPVEVAVKHVADSLLLLRFAPFPGATLDFGSGGGYPGIPLAIALPEARVVLLESSAKKCAFLSRVRSLLALDNVEVLRARIEEKKRLRIGPFDRIVTRAAIAPPKAVALLAPYLAPGGRLLLMTGPGDVPRAGAPRPGPGGVRGATLSGAQAFSLPRGMGERLIVQYSARPGPDGTA